jgi:hypothetical protein
MRCSTLTIACVFVLSAVAHASELDAYRFYSVDFENSATTAMSVEGDSAVFALGADRVGGVNLRTGAAWNRRLGAYISSAQPSAVSVAFANEALAVVGTTSNHVMGMTPDTVVLNVDVNIFVVAPMITARMSDNKTELLVFGGSSDQAVHARHAMDSGLAPVWRTSVQDSFTTAAVVAPGPSVIVAGERGKIHCLSVDDGAPLWQSAVEGQAVVNPVVVGNDTASAVVVVATDSELVGAFRVSTGERRWNVAVGARASAPLVVLEIAGASLIVVPLTSGSVLALRADGSVAWRVDGLADPIAGCVAIASSATLTSRLAPGIHSSSLVACGSVETSAIVIDGVDGRVVSHVQGGRKHIGPPAFVTDPERPLLVWLSSQQVIGVDVAAWSETFSRNTLWPPGSAHFAAGTSVRSGVIVGAVIGGCILVATVAVIIYCVRRRSAMTRNDPAAPRTPVAVAPEHPAILPAALFADDDAVGGTTQPSPNPPLLKQTVPPSSSPLDVARYALCAAMRVRDANSERQVPWPLVRYLTDNFRFEVPGYRSDIAGCRMYQGFDIAEAFEHPVVVVVATVCAESPIPDNLRVYGTSRHEVGISRRDDQVAWVIRGRCTSLVHAPPDGTLNDEIAAAIQSVRGTRINSWSPSEPCDAAQAITGCDNTLATAVRLDTLENVAVAFVGFEHSPMQNWVPFSGSAKPGPPTVLRECAICFATIEAPQGGGRVEGCLCTNFDSRHFVCGECVNGRLEAHFGSERHDLDAVTCPIAPCQGMWRLEDITSLLTPPTLRQWHEVTVRMTAQRAHGERRLSTTFSSPEDRELVATARRLLRLVCPHCGLPFESFSGCVSVRCEVRGVVASDLRGCGEYFCGACVTVQPCQLNHGHAFMSPQELAVHWNRWREARIAAYLSQLASRKRIVVVDALRADCAALGMAPLKSP